MSVTLDDVGRVARLARMRLEPDEAARMRDELATILKYMERLRGVDTEGVEPFAHPHLHACRLRRDLAAPGLERDELLAQAPDGSEGMFRVPPVGVGEER